MFGNLKNKLSDVADLKKFSTPQISSSLTSSRHRSNQHTPGCHTPSISKHSRHPSDASASSFQGTSGTILHGKLQELDEQENDFSHSESVSKESKTSCEQQISLKHKFIAKEQEWKSQLSESQKQVSYLENELKEIKNREELFIRKLSKINAEKISNQQNLVENETRLKETESRLVNLQENYDELEGLSAQELSKTKHLLLNTSAEFETTKAELEQKCYTIKSLERKVKNFEGLEGRLRVFSDEKMDLETKLAGLSHQLSFANAKLTSESERHREEVARLQEKIVVANKRESRSSMDDEDKIDDMVKERETYERKLEETRQQLDNIKSSWSDKISSLEKQIEHLNKKIAEDQFDLRSSENYCEELEKKIAKLNLELESKSCEYKKENERMAKEIDRLNEDVESGQWNMNNQITSKDVKIRELEKIIEMKEAEIQQHVIDRESKTSKNKELEKSLQELRHKTREFEVQILELQHKLDSLNGALINTQERLQVEGEKSRSLDSECRSLKEKCETAVSEKNKLSENLDSYLEKTKILENKTEKFETENDELNLSLTRLETENEELESKNVEITLKLESLESDFLKKVKESELVKELKDKINKFEDEITEKNQLLKVHSQRMADMKKTLQKELKINSESNFNDKLNPEVNGEISQLSPRLKQKNFENKNNLKSNRSTTSVQMIRTNDLRPTEINLEYLKNVILKFITSKEDESIQLIKAVATLLSMNEDEENLLRESLEYRMSWFAVAPPKSKNSTVYKSPGQNKFKKTYQ